MRKDDFLGHYWSYPLRWTEGQTAYVRGHSEWCQLIFHPNREIHDLAFWMLKTQSDQMHNRAMRQWWMWWKMPDPPLWTMVFMERERPTGTLVDRLLAWSMTLYAVRRML